MAADPYTIIHADDSLVVVAKAPGVPSQRDASGDLDLTMMLKESLGKQPLVVHRIDRPASGLVVYARNTGAAAKLSALFRSGLVERRYWAIVGARPADESGTLQHRLVTVPARNKTYVSDTRGKTSELRYRLAARSDRYWLLDVELQTGRHHQIRAQLAAIGCPIRGDVKYGAKRTLRGGGIGLHAYRLAFPHPVTSNPLSFFAPPPDDTLWVALSRDLLP